MKPRRAQSLAGAALLGAALAASCGLPLEDQTATFSNRCSGDADCDAGSACVSTSGGDVCASTQADLGAVYLEVRSTNQSGVATTFLFKDAVDVQGEAAAGIVLRGVDLELPALANFTGRYIVQAPQPPGCKADDGSVPAKVELRSSDGYPGIDNQIAAKTSLVDGSHRFATGVPPGTYDVYVQSEISRADCDAPPPRFYPGGLVVPPDVGEVEFTLAVEPWEDLAVELQVPVETTLEGWEFEVVEPAQGKPISDTVVLGPPTGSIVDVSLKYYFTQNALLRLSHPERDLSVHWKLTSLPKNGEGVIGLDLRDLAANPHEITGSIADGVPGAKVTIQSKSLTGSANQNAAYRYVTESDAQGIIHASLVEGDYSVTIVPVTPGLAMRLDSWEIGPCDATCSGNGKGFELPPQPRLVGSVVTAGGEAASGAPLVVNPSQPGSTNYFVQAIEPPSLTPRQFTGSVGASGGVDIAVDPGMIDLSIQVSSETGYPWAVLPRIVVILEDKEPVVDLGRLEVPYPAVVEGAVRSPGGSVPYAVVRAWIPVESSAGGAGLPPLVQVGETITDAQGRYFLPLPPSITLPSSE